ncbi:MAG: DUF87 domain-containing protein, partial [Deltaproteobacteria bacterium]
MNEYQVAEYQLLKVGKVIAVDGRQIKIHADKLKNDSHVQYKDELLKDISVGTYVKIIKENIKVIGKIEGEYLANNKYGQQSAKEEYKNEQDSSTTVRILNVVLLGFIKGLHFERGIKESPLIDNECFLLEGDEFILVHSFSNKNDESIAIGTLTLEAGHKACVGVNALFATHIGIFGNTGSGKSYTLAKIYRELLMQYKDKIEFQQNANFCLIDFNGEYVGDDIIIDRKYKHSYELSTQDKKGKDKFPIYEKTIN